MRRIIHILLLVSIFTISVGSPTILRYDGERKMNVRDVRKERLIGGEYTLVGGDIRIPTSEARNGIRNPAKHWPSGVIPYEITGNYAKEEMEILMKGMEEYHKFTCIKFVPKTAAHDSYVSIGRDENGCFADLGYAKGRQIINYGPRCLEYVGSAIHEMMHIVGFDHEHNRSDRDEYLEIKLENVEKDLENNFNKVDEKDFTDYGVPYNYNSVMHYYEDSFSKDGELPTMVAKKPHDKPIGGVFTDTFAKTDITKINRMYKCKARSCRRKKGQSG